MRNQHESFLAIAGKVAELDDFVKKLKESYIEYRMRYFGDDRNPFDKKQKKEGMLEIVLSLSKHFALNFPTLLTNLDT